MNSQSSYEHYSAIGDPKRQRDSAIIITPAPRSTVHSGGMLQIATKCQISVRFIKCKQPEITCLMLNINTFHEHCHSTNKNVETGMHHENFVRFDLCLV